MLSANGRFKLVLKAALAWLVILVAIEIAIRAIAKRFMPNRISVKRASLSRAERVAPIGPGSPRL